LRTERSESLEYAEDNVMSEFGSAMDLYFGGDMNASIALCGQVAGRIDAVRPVAEVLTEIVEQFEATLTDVAERYLRGE
jgi:enoyl-[acyl-carrier protein] reductase II